MKQIGTKHLVFLSMLNLACSADHFTLLPPDIRACELSRALEILVVPGLRIDTQ